MKINILFIWLTQIITIFLNILFQSRLSHEFQMKEVGSFFTNLTLLNILFTIGQLGLNKYLLILYTKYKPITAYNKNNLLKAYILVNVTITIVYLTIVYFLNSSDLKIAFLLIPIGILTNLIIIYTTFIQVFSKYFAIGIFNMLIPLIKVISILFVIMFLENTILDFAWLLFIISLITMVYIIKNIIKLQEKFFDEAKGNKFLEEVTVWEFIKILFPYTVLNFTFLVYTQGTTFILGVFSGKVDAVIFANAYFILNAFFIFPSIIFQKVYAHKFLELIYKKEIATLKSIVRKIDIIMAGFSIIVIIVLLFFSDYIVSILYGIKYMQSSTVFKSLLLIIPFRLFQISRGTIMSSDFMIKFRLRIEIILTMFSFISTIIATYFFGLYGAIVIVIANEILICLCFMYFVMKYIFKNKLRSCETYE